MPSHTDDLRLAHILADDADSTTMDRYKALDLHVATKPDLTPVSESEQYYTALQLRGVPTALVKVPGASHGGIAARPSQSGAKAAAILAWFERYRNGVPAQAASPTP